MEIRGRGRLRARDLTLKASLYCCSPEKLAQLLLKEVEPFPIFSPSHKMIDKTSNIRHYDNFVKTRRKMTTAKAFSRQNDAGSRASTSVLLRKSLTLSRPRFGI